MHMRMKEIQEFKDVTFTKLNGLFEEISEAELSNDSIDDLSKAWDILKDMAKCHYYAYGHKTIDTQVATYMGKMKDLAHVPGHTHQLIASTQPAPQEL